MSIDIHDFGVFAFMAIVVINMILLLSSGEIRAYAKRMRVLMPVSASMIAVIIFTGTVMMAAKHLSFTVENILMIIFSIMLIVLEAKRYKTLKRLDLSEENAFGSYKVKAMKLMGIALGGSLLISAWMLV
ncbi:MAG: hypothetical protein R3302_05395 [Sulfurimonadaceae bacterium]|nr:hypothetical protein [Sulfurimonadaceae bacterium]